MSEYVECVAKVTLAAEDPLWRRICRIAAQHGERPEELVGFLAGVGIREHLRKVLDCYYPEEGVRCSSCMWTPQKVKSSASHREKQR